MTEELTCQEIIEIVTDYIDHAMSPGDEQRFERHLSYCPGCVTYVEQIRETIRLTGQAPRQESLPPALREGLLGQFRTWQRAG